MHLRLREIRAKDARPCSELLATMPHLLQRYGSTIGHFADAWHRVLRDQNESIRGVIVENVDGPVRLLAFAALVFTTDDFVQECKRSPLFWIGPELIRRVLRGNSPILNLKQIREANSTSGLNAVVWQDAVRPMALEERMIVEMKIMEGFDRVARGYCLKEMIGQAPDSLNAQIKVNTGGFLWHADERRYEPLTQEKAETLDGLHLVGMTMDLVLNNPGSFLSIVLARVPPRIFFSASEQRLLCAALDGATDEELSDVLGVSLAMIKKTWRAVYHRVETRSPEVLPENQNEGSSAAARSKEKRRRLLAYLRDHASELRPFSEKLLARGAAKNS